MVPGDNPTAVYLLGVAVAALFGLLTKVIAVILQRSDDAVKAANSNAATAIAEANQRTENERARYDKLIDRVVTVVERLDENVGGFYAILDGHLRYMREAMADLLADPPAPPPPSQPPVPRPQRRKAGEGGD